jgi:hypothetical protein
VTASYVHGEWLHVLQHARRTMRCR